MSETRSTVILTRLARKLRKDTGNHRYRARVEDERGSFRNLLYVSCTRPLCKLYSFIFFQWLSTVRKLTSIYPSLVVHRAHRV